MVFDLGFVNRALALPPLARELEELGVNGVCTDTRKLTPGQLFVALKGPNFDGHNFVPQAFKLGAVACLVERGYQYKGDALLLQTQDTLQALGDLALAWRSEQPAKVLAVTGSSGKTTSKEMLALVLAQRYNVLKTKGNLNNLIGLPLTLLELNASHGAAVVEMGMSWPGEIARLTQIAEPDLGLITNVGPAHLQNMGSLKNIAAAKTELWSNIHGIAVVNLDDPLLAPWARKFNGQVITFGQNPKAQVKAGKIQNMGFAQTFMLELPAGQPVLVKLGAPGEHNLQNALGVAAAAFAMGLSAEEIREGLSGYQAGSGRFRMLSSANGALILDDAYNANPSSVAAGLKTMAGLQHYYGGNRRAVAVLGDMLELGPKSPTLHRQIGELAVDSNCELLLAYGSMAPEVIKGAKSAGLAAAYAFGEMNELRKALLEKLTGKDIVLVKGSNSMGMESIVTFLEQELKEN